YCLLHTRPSRPPLLHSPTRPPPPPPPFPYTTLFRSGRARSDTAGARRMERRRRPANRPRRRRPPARSAARRTGRSRPRRPGAAEDRKSTRSELQSLRHLVCRLLLEKKKEKHEMKHDT